MFSRCELPILTLFHASGKTESDEERFKVLDAAYEQGCTFWDTANVYGDSEDLIGKWCVQPPSSRQTCSFLTGIVSQVQAHWEAQ
jgi:aryl-alcohol dehydrogenase-like predicted oxidoreductase